MEPGAPLGAIHNGRALADRLEATGFTCAAGDLAHCSDWQDFRSCFEHLVVESIVLSTEARKEEREVRATREATYKKRTRLTLTAGLVATLCAMLSVWLWCVVSPQFQAALSFQAIGFSAIAVAAGLVWLFRGAFE